MADAALSLVTTKLGSLLVEEAELLAGVKDEMEWIKNELHSMQAFLRDADRRKLTDESLITWIQQVRDVAYDAEDTIDEYVLRMKRPHRGGRFAAPLLNFLHCIINLIPHHQIAKKLQGIKARVGEIYERSQRYKLEKLEDVKSVDEGSEMVQYYRELHPLMVEEHELVGIEQPREQLLNWLTKGEPGLTVISVVGMGGLGKTTLARKAYASARVRSHFECYAWTSGSRSVGIRGFLIEIITTFFEEAKMEVANEFAAMNDEGLVEKIKSFLSRKRYVLVLDDVWSFNFWSMLKLALPDDECGSRIVITTRIDNLASSIGAFEHVLHLQSLRFDDSWALFRRIVFRLRECPQELEELSQTIVKRCGGLPLAIIAVGGLMAKTEKTLVEWKKVDNSLSWEFSTSQTLESERSILLLSYHNLPNYLKPCFLYCSIFPEDYQIAVQRLIRLWVAEGFLEARKGLTMEETGEVYLRELIDRSMLQVVKKNESGRVKACRVHDLMRDLALSVIAKENFCGICDTSGANVLTKSRRLSIHQFGEDESLNTSMLNLRSFFFFGEQMSSTSLLTNLMCCKLLRVLDLQGSSIEKLPRELFKLFHLRHLGLRNTKISMIPRSLSNLGNLQTLDIRRTGVAVLPDEVCKLHSLRHLYANFNELALGVSKLPNLQTLKDVYSTEGLPCALASLTQLKRLGICGIRSEDGKELCTSINSMKNLMSLTILVVDLNEPIQLETLVHPSPFLQKLYLCGTLENLPPWLAPLRSLTQLRLTWSSLKEDPFLTLQALPNLVNLALVGAYNGLHLHGEAGGFPSLKFLQLGELKNVKSVTVEEGSMPNICELFIYKCDGLQRVPCGIEYLKSLELLHFKDMPESFIKKIRPNEGEDCWKVQHIHDVLHFFGDDGNEHWEQFSYK